MRGFRISLLPRRPEKASDISSTQLDTTELTRAAPLCVFNVLTTFFKTISEHVKLLIAVYLVGKQKAPLSLVALHVEIEHVAQGQQTMLSISLRGTNVR